MITTYTARATDTSDSKMILAMLWDFWHNIEKVLSNSERITKRFSLMKYEISPLISSYSSSQHALWTNEFSEAFYKFKNIYICHLQNL